MALPYIDTPRTEAGNATYLTNGYRSIGRTNLSALDSVENSFQTPSKDEDIIKILEDGRRRTSGGFKVTTPRAGSGPKSNRSALADRRHLPTIAPPKGEFTPLMKSATKNSFLKTLSAARGTTGTSKTPAHLRASYRSNVNTPGLPAMEMTDIYEEDGSDDDPTPLPQVASSSAQSTPLPGLLGRNGRGMLDDANVLSLREQENKIDQLEKDNFGLKLKIHYLQQQVERAGPGYHQEALRENTELKISSTTMQRDIARYKKQLHHAERDLESYRLQFQELREKYRKRQVDETVQREMELMRDQIETRNSQVRELQDELRDSKQKQSREIDKLRDDLEDLEASLREKDRLIEARDEEIENLKDKDSKDHDAIAELEVELESAKQQMAELQDRLEQSRSETEEAQNAEQRAMEEKAQAEEDLRELQDEMANKSFTTKGLSRQLEEKGSRLEEELQEARKQNDTLKDELESKARHEARLEEQFQKVRREMNEERQRLLDEADISRDELNTLQQEHEKLAAQLQDALDDLKRKEDEKDLLHTRHHALTDESGSLQRELARAQSTIRELQQAVDDEKRNSLESNQGLRTQNKEEIEHLQEEIESLHHEIEDKEGRFALDEDRWESTKRTLQLQKERAEEQAAGFKRTIEKLQQVEHSLSGKEIKLQEVIDSEKTRHHHEEAVLSRQVQELNDDLASKRQVIEELRTDFLSTKEELRISKREEQALKEKVQALEDEVVILQASLEDEREYAKGKVKKGPSDIETQLQKATTDKQSLRDQLANANVELHRLKTSLAEFEVERDELQAQLDQAQNQAGNTHQFDKEKVDLRKSKLRLESEVTRLKEERSSLVKAKESIETQLNAEIERATTDENRLSAEIDQLQDRLATASGDKDRELVLSKSRTQRLERRIHELEALVEQQVHVEPEVSIGNADVSLLRHNLDEARKRERALLQREADQKALVRSFKTRIADLEKELHDALMKKYDTNSPVSSPSDKLHSELRSLRKQLSEAHKSLRDLRAKNRDLERNAMREEDQRDLHELLKSSTLEAESLALKVSERDARLNELKTQVRKVREERAFCVKKAETASKELATLQDRYDQAIEKIGVKSENKGRHEKEIRGLSREIIWLRARLKREERFRRDLAWSKGLMELGERVRTACNEADLRMIAEMGVKARSPDHSRTPRHKFKTAISMVVATVRMQKMGREWKKTKKLSEGLKRAKNEVLKRRDG